MSRIERKIGEEANASVDAAEILAELARASGGSPKRRQEAISCYFSASDGWREAEAMLGGAFAARDQESKAKRKL